MQITFARRLAFVPLPSREARQYLQYSLRNALRLQVSAKPSTSLLNGESACETQYGSKSSLSIQLVINTQSIH